MKPLRILVTTFLCAGYGARVSIVGSSLVMLVALSMTELTIADVARAGWREHFAEEDFKPAPASWWECYAEAQVATKRNESPPGGSGTSRLLVDAKSTAMKECISESRGAVCVIVTCHHPCQSDCGG
jgi:hypothetical protein